MADYSRTTEFLAVISHDSVGSNDNPLVSTKHKTTPGSLYHLSLVMPHGNYTGDESMHIVDTISIDKNYNVWIGDYNTQINVKGDSAYEVYVKVCHERGIIPLSEEEWIDSIGTNFESIYNYAVRTWGYPHTMGEFYNNVENFVDIESE